VFVKHDCFLIRSSSSSSSSSSPSPPLLHSSSKDAVKSEWVQFSWVGRERAHTQAPYIPWKKWVWKKETKRKELLVVLTGSFVLAALILKRICTVAGWPTHSGGTNSRHGHIFYNQNLFSNSAKKWNLCLILEVSKNKPSMLECLLSWRQVSMLIVERDDCLVTLTRWKHLPIALNQMLSYFISSFIPSRWYLSSVPLFHHAPITVISLHKHHSSQGCFYHLGKVSLPIEDIHILFSFIVVCVHFCFLLPTLFFILF